MSRIPGLFLIVLTLLAGCGGSGGGGGGGGGNQAALVQGANADLSELTLSAGSLDQVFQSNQLDYTATVGFLIATTTVRPTTDDPNATVTVNGRLVISGTASGSIALDEGLNTIEVIVTAEDGVTTKIYTVDVTRQTAADFARQAYLKASNAEENDYLGFSVALSGDTLAVGAVGKNSDVTNETDIGAVYVFTRDNNGNWAQQDFLQAFNAEENDQFGFSVALSGDTLAVSAVGKNSDGNINVKTDVGAVYVFTRNNNGDWLLQDFLRAFNAEENDQFGFSVALSGDTLAVGAVGKNSDGNINVKTDVGAVYVFTRDNNGDWAQQDFLQAFNAEAGDLFGGAVALSGDTLAVGAVGKNSDVTNEIDVGAVYVFTRDNNGDWAQQDFLQAFNAEAGDLFGGAVALSGDTLAVSAAGKNSDVTNEIDVGAVYVFARDNNGDWAQQDFLRAFNAEENDQFGFSVALSGNTLVVGAIGKNSDVTNEIDVGAVYVFIRDNSGDWAQQDFLQASNAAQSDEFGFSVALSGDTLAVGAVGKNSAGNIKTDVGAVYVFR